MQKTLIDIFIVPEASKESFVERTREIQSFLKSLPGFIEGYLYIKTAGENKYNIMTTATWENAEAIEKTKQAVTEYFKRNNLNPQEFKKNLQIIGERGIYERVAY